ncbi:MAG: NAD(P)/FAD-dependent oxidoreductase [Candidatus Kuenenia sp.]|nr:NAD(P)/FAD-dependent oxidoreductase [Candidatus Kuenenia hertensis]
MNTKHIIIGNGVAGVQAAKNIRKFDSLADIKIFTDEHYLFYSKPRLPELLAKEITIEETFVFNQSWYQENNIQIYCNHEINYVEPGKQTVTLTNKTCFPYDKLLFATGSTSKLPPISGINTGKGVFTLRTIEDVKRITKYAESSKSAIIIGGGLLGIEAGNGLKKSGLSVTVVEYFDRLLPKQLDSEGSGILQRQMEDIGLSFVLGARSSAIKEKENKKVLELMDRDALECDFILVSAGIVPSCTLAKNAGISINKGIIVNDYMETNITNIYAAGDVAEHRNTTYGIWPAAHTQGVIAGTNMAGGHIPYMGTVPSTRLKVAGIHLISVGNISPEDDTVEQIKVKYLDKKVYKKLFIKEGIPVGAIFLGETKNAYELGQIIENKIDISLHKKEILNNDFNIKKIKTH